MREGAGTDFTPRFVAEEGQTFLVQAGPEDADGYQWWYIVNPDEFELQGWAANLFLERVASAG